MIEEEMLNEGQEKYIYRRCGYSTLKNKKSEITRKKNINTYYEECVMMEYQKSRIRKRRHKGQDGRKLTAEAWEIHKSEEK